MQNTLPADKYTEYKNIYLVLRAEFEQQIKGDLINILKSLKIKEMDILRLKLT